MAVRELGNAAGNPLGLARASATGGGGFPKIKRKYATTGAVTFDAPLDLRKTLVTAIGVGDIYDSGYNAISSRLQDFLVGAGAKNIFQNLNIPSYTPSGVQVYISENSAQVLAVNGANSVSLQVIELDEEIASYQTIEISGGATTATFNLSIPVTNPEKTYYSYATPGHGTYGSFSISGRVMNFGDFVRDSCLPYNATYHVPFGFLDGSTIKRFPGGGSTAFTLTVVEFK